MKRSAVSKSALAGALAICLCLPAKVLATGCCDDSETGCKTGQNVGDSCGGGNVCVAITDKCTKKKPEHPGVDCSCTTNNSKLEVSPSLDFATLNLSANPSETKNLKVKNGGGVPFDVTYCVTAGSDNFSALSPGTQTGAILPPVSKAVSPDMVICTGRVEGTQVPELGFANLPLKLAPQLSGAYTGSLHIESTDALSSSTDVSLVGKGKGLLSLGFRMPTIPITKLGGSAELACNKSYIGVVFANLMAQTNSTLMYSTSTNQGKTFSKPLTLYDNLHLLSDPLIVRALTGNGFQVMYTDETTNPESVWTFPYTPGQSSTITPLQVTTGRATSLDEGGGYYWLGVDAVTPSISAQFWGSTDGMKWNQYTVPVGTNFTSDANIVYGWGHLWAVWTDYGTTLSSPINRYASLSTNFGLSFNPALLFHAFPANSTVAYFSPTTFFSEGTLLDFGTSSSNFPTVPFTSFVDYLTPGASSPLGQQIGGNGFEAPFGRLYNRSFLAGIVNNVPSNSNADTLTGFSGELGGTFKYTPTSKKTVLEARFFDVGVRI